MVPPSEHLGHAGEIVDQIMVQFRRDVAAIRRGLPPERRGTVRKVEDARVRAGRGLDHAADTLTSAKRALVLYGERPGSRGDVERMMDELHRLAEHIRMARLTVERTE